MYDRDDSNVTTRAEELQGRFRMTDGFELFYRRWKTPHEVKRVVVCIHGIGEHSGFFRFIGQNLASYDEAEVYAIDLRGFGNSKEKGLPIGDTSDFKKYLQDVVEVVGYVRKNHPGKKLFIFGHSMGGLHALWYVANRSDPPDGLIIAGSSASALPRGEKISVRQFPRIARVVFYLLFARKAMFDMYVRGFSIFEKSQEFRDHEEFLVNDPLSTGRFTWRYMTSLGALVRKATQNASKIHVPTVMIQGEADYMVSPAGTKKIFEKLASKDKSLQTFADADHYFYHTIFPMVTSKYDLERQMQVTNTISDWLSAH